MIQEFHYEIAWRARSPYPGHHRGTQCGAGFEFRGHAPLLAAPDPRRLDMRASLHDPFGQWMVRVYRQRSSIRVFLLADLSASMGFSGVTRKLEVLEVLAASTAYSAYRSGDAFGFIGCDEDVRHEFLLLPTRIKGAGMELNRRLLAFTPMGKGVGGLLHTPQYMGRQRALVLLASDFHFSLDLLEQVLDALSSHAVAPIVIWDRAEFAQLPRFGLGMVTDSETGERCRVFMRAGLNERIAEAFEMRRQELVHVFHTHGIEPLFLTGGFSADRMTDYFYRHQPGRAGVVIE